jgi:proteasome lid subunit RPN8/RPN11
MIGDSEVQGMEINNIDLKDFPYEDFPGVESFESFRVFLEEKEYDLILGHANEDVSVELCGVLVGEMCQDSRGPFLKISNTIRGEYSGSQEAQVTFTQETWAHIFKEMDLKYSDKKLVGWYHTHPGFGVFLSPMDLFIHESFFNISWQVAFVVDPRSGEEGFFSWNNGGLEPIRHYWIGAEERIWLGPNSKQSARYSGRLDVISALREEEIGERGCSRPFWCTATRVLLVLVVVVVSFIGGFCAPKSWGQQSWGKLTRFVESTLEAIRQ